MGVLNVTPDSFSDGGRFSDPVARGAELITEGADVVDVGGESTRPSAEPVACEKELSRVVPVVRALAGRVTLSVDTYKAQVADAAIVAGAEIINDISGGLLDPEILQVAARHQAVLLLGHLRGTPATMTAYAEYEDVVSDVVRELGARIEAAARAGVQRIWVDPGLGFAKTAEQSSELLRRLRALQALGCPIVVGASRKSFLGKLTGRGVFERELGTAAADAIAIGNGAAVVRVHDVAGQRDAVRVADALYYGVSQERARAKECGDSTLRHGR
jgi:dihydropteroate synthase